jgi:hypothetical protein
MYQRDKAKKDLEEGFERSDGTSRSVDVGNEKESRGNGPRHPEMAR